MLIYYRDGEKPIPRAIWRDCTVDLDDLSTKGRVAEREIGEALTWIEANKDFLFDEWQRNNP